MSEIKQILHSADPCVHATDQCISAYYIYLVLFKAFQALVEYVRKQYFFYEVMELFLDPWRQNLASPASSLSISVLPIP